VKRHNRREIRKENANIKHREKGQHSNIENSILRDESESESEDERSVGYEKNAEVLVERREADVRVQSTVERARQHHVENKERIRAIIEGANREEEREYDYKHMQEAIKSGHIMVRHTGKTKMVQLEPRFSTRRAKEERQKAHTNTQDTQDAIVGQTMEKLLVEQARRNTNRGESPEDRWFMTIEDAGDIIGKIWGKGDLTGPIRKALQLRRCPTVANYKYQWEWVLPIEHSIETRHA
jgi:hypothetical protein